MKTYWKISFAIIGTLFFLQACKKDNTSYQDPSDDFFDIVWSDFDQTYPYFIHKGINWDSVHSEYSSRIHETTSMHELSDLIGEMTMVLKDIHVRFTSSFGTYHYSKKLNYPENPPDNAFTYLDTILSNNSIGAFGYLANTNFVYLRINTFIGSTADFSDLAAMLDHIASTDGLVVDIRSNGGGNEINGRAIAGRFTETDTPYRYSRVRDGSSWSDFTSWRESLLTSTNYLDYHKPVILLTNRRVYSSAELFVLMMKTYDQLTIVGDTTGAASANPAERSLSNGWQYYVSTWQAASLNYELIEDNGIAPDHYVLMTEESIAEGRDLILEKAIDLLSASE